MLFNIKVNILRCTVSKILKLYMFRTVPLSLTRTFSLYTQQNCMTYTIAVRTVKNSWWWTEELSEICRDFSKNKFEKLVHLVGFIIRITLKVFHKTVVLNWHWCFGVSPYFGHRMKSVNYEHSLLGSLHWANLFLHNNKPKRLRFYFAVFTFCVIKNTERAFKTVLTKEEAND